MEDNQPDPLNVSLDDAKQILVELTAFRKTKLFAHIAAKRNQRLKENFAVILEGDISTPGLVAEREALIGETRLWRDFIREISGNIEEEMKSLLDLSDDNEETTNQQPL